MVCCTELSGKSSLGTVWKKGRYSQIFGIWQVIGLTSATTRRLIRCFLSEKKKLSVNNCCKYWWLMLINSTQCRHLACPAVWVDSGSNVKKWKTDTFDICSGPSQRVTCQNNFSIPKVRLKSQYVFVDTLGFDLWTPFYKTITNNFLQELKSVSLTFIFPPFFTLPLNNPLKQGTQNLFSPWRGRKLWESGIPRLSASEIQDGKSL